MAPQRRRHRYHRGPLQTGGVPPAHPAQDGRTGATAARATASGHARGGGFRGHGGTEEAREAL
eukprot:12889509-Prorocentrum_lima.AAC.1